MAMFAGPMQPYAPALGGGNFGMVQAPVSPYVQARGPAIAPQVNWLASPKITPAPAVARAPMGFAAPAPAGYGYQAGAPFQMQQPGAAYPGQKTLSANVMAKVKDLSINHHWRDLAKKLNPAFLECGSGAQGLTYPQLQKFYATVGSQFFGEPLDYLLNPDIFERFDFNGDGTLEFIQAFKSLKCVLYEIFHHAGEKTRKPLEFKTPAQKGYTIIKELARGGQGAAILASSPERGQVVLKTYEKSNPNAGTIEEHVAEMEVLRELQQESNVMHAWDIFQDDKCVYCVNELMAGGDLESLREKTAKACISLTQDYFRDIFKQTLVGLDHIHQHGLMHCDLKEPNVMIKNTDLRCPQVAIIDFGLAHVCAGPGEAGGTPGYIPPETNARHIWYPKGDIFALGVAFFQLLADKTPNEKLMKLGVFQEGFRTLDDVVRFTATRPLPLRLIEGQYPGVLSWLPSMCSKEKKPRPRALALLELPFFTQETSMNLTATAQGVSVIAQPAVNPLGYPQNGQPKQVQWRSKLVSEYPINGRASTPQILQSSASIGGFQGLGTSGVQPSHMINRPMQLAIPQVAQPIAFQGRTPLNNQPVQIMNQPVQLGSPSAMVYQGGWNSTYQGASPFGDQGKVSL